MPKYLGELLSFIILIVLVVLMITGGEVWYEISTINNYRSECVKIAQRSNGFTQADQSQMNALGKDYYGNRMHVVPMNGNNVNSSSDNPYQQVNYGHDIGFRIQANITKFNALFIQKGNYSDVNDVDYISVYVPSQARNNTFE